VWGCDGGVRERDYICVGSECGDVKVERERERERERECICVGIECGDVTLK
jgi:hypothetical protein